jgi:hypothetical protein
MLKKRKVELEKEIRKEEIKHEKTLFNHPLIVLTIYEILLFQE